MKRLETLVREARADLRARSTWAGGNGVGALEVARAVDRIREAEEVLRRAYEGGSKGGAFVNHKEGR